jgi:hypothetical protein
MQQKFLALLRHLFTRRNGMRILFAIAFLAALWAAFCIEEKWRGRRVWQRYSESARERGVPLDVAAVLRPKVPDAENFAAIPMIQNLFTAAEAHEPLPVWFEALKMDSADDRRPNFHGTQAPSLTAWRDHFVREGVIPSAGPDPAADVLAAIEKVRPELDELRETGRRPHSKFPVKWELGFAAYLPHLQPLIKATNVYQLSATAHLARGESAAACDDLRDAVRIYTALDREPALICGLVRLGIVEKVAARVRDGIAAGRWDAPELEKLQALFAGIRIADDWRYALNSERAVVNSATMELHERSDRSLAQAANDLTGNSVSRGSISTSEVTLYPRGWLWLSQRKVNEFFDRSIDRVDAIAAGKPFVLPSDAAADVERLATAGPLARLPYLLYVIFTPALGNVENKYLHCLSTVAQAQLACALDRHRLAKGAYPEQLGAIIPEFITALPRDPITQASMLYRKTPAGGFELWSVGLNRTNDSAAELPGKDPKDQPDWVWRR